MILFFADCKNKRSSRHYETDLILDSNSIAPFFAHHKDLKDYKHLVDSFYAEHNYRFVWIGSKGMHQQASGFMNMLRQDTITFRSPSPSVIQLRSLYSSLEDDRYKFKQDDSLTKEMELLLTASFFDYAKRNWTGLGKEYSNRVDWFIDRKRVDYEAMLDSVLMKKTIVEPVYKQYAYLKKYLAIYAQIEKQEGWPDWTAGVKTLKKGDTSDVIPQVKKQLTVMGDLGSADDGNIFDDDLENAVRKFQARHGLEEDGIISGATLKQMAVPVQDRINQLLINMERARWVPVQPTGDYLTVNIPQFKLHVYHNDSLQWSTNVVVGKTTNSTVIFNDNMEYIILNPYWNIPKNILTQETLPEIQMDDNYLASHNMEVVDNSGNPIKSSSIRWASYEGDDFPYIVRQKPGLDNALGKMKFVFPNSYDIYLHDTPAKSLFDENKRAFSHGCIRVEEPGKLLEYLTRDNKDWPHEKIDKVLASGKEATINLKKKVPVFIAYFTAWVDNNGKLNFRDDIYGHDEKMYNLLF